MNKTFLAFFFALSILSANAGITDTLGKLNDAIGKSADAIQKGLDTAGKYISAAETTYNSIMNVVNSITKEFENVSSDVKTLAAEIESEFDSLYNDGVRIVEITKKFATAGYSDAKTLYTDLKTQLDLIIAAAQADVQRAGSAAKTSVSQFSTDIQIIYSDGKLVVERFKDTADLETAIDDIKSKNTESLKKTVEAINKALEEANGIIKQAQEYLDKYKGIATSTATDAKATVDSLVSTMNEFITSAEAKLKEFKTNQKANLKTIVSDAESLYKSTQSILDKVQDTLKRTQEAYKRGEQVVNDEIAAIDDAWSKEGLENGSTANGSLKDVQDVIDKAKTEVDNISDTGQKVVTAVGSAEKTLTAAMDEVMSQVSAIEFKASKDCTVYTKADSSSTKAGSLKKGDKVKVIGQSGLWSKIEENKWVESKHLTIADSSQAKEKANSIKDTLDQTLTGIKSLFNF